MSKIATYLQEHILGEVATNPMILKSMSHDGGLMRQIPEIVVYPRLTSDIRKIAKFVWQLAEKGHNIPITARGYGNDVTGASIGEGVVMSFPAHMNNIFEFDTKRKLIRLQPGVSVKSLHDSMMLYGVGLPFVSDAASCSTVGGAISNNSGGYLSGRHGSVTKWVDQLEVVLADGEAIQTGRISKHELNRKKGLQTFEGEIYRNLDNLIEDNKELIYSNLSNRSNVGYSSIVNVKGKDGSFDLTPLFCGSQGTLGIISEIIMKGDFMSSHYGVAVMTFKDNKTAYDAIGQLHKLGPAFVEFYDGVFFDIAADEGKKYSFIKDERIGAAIVIGFDDFSEHVRQKKLKKIEKVFTKIKDASIFVADGEDAEKLLIVRDVASYSYISSNNDTSSLPTIDGAYVPIDKFEEFNEAVYELGKKLDVVIPVKYQALDGIVRARPMLHSHKSGDKQKIFKIMVEYGNLVAKCGGSLIGDDGEGRLKAAVAYSALDHKIVNLFESIRNIFDPYNILNTGVKQTCDAKHLSSLISATQEIPNGLNNTPYC